MINKYRTDKSLVAWVDLSTYCNAACPQCHRTDLNGLDKVDWLPLTQWTLQEFIEAFPLKDIRKYKRFEICGTWGDPLMCKDILEICKYIVENSNAWIQLNTNAGMRDEEFYWDLGILTRNRMQLIFDIEGITQEMHSHYRRKVELEKVKSNIQNFTAAGGNALAHVIVFKHNENHLYEILDMCYNELQVTDHIIQPSNRFHKEGKQIFIDENGNEAILEEMEIKDHPLLNYGIVPNRDHSWFKNKGKKYLNRGLWTPKDAVDAK